MREITLHSNTYQLEMILILDDEDLVVGVRYIFDSPRDISIFLSTQSQQPVAPVMRQFMPPVFSNPITTPPVIQRQLTSPEATLETAQPLSVTASPASYRTIVHDGGATTRQVVSPPRTVRLPSKGCRGC